MATGDEITIPDALSEKFVPEREVNLLVIGRFGVGKSTLINSMFLQNSTEQAKVGVDMQRCTSEPKPYTIEVDGIKFHIWDTPGLQDGECDDRKYITMIAEKCPKVNLVIYCTNMQEPIRESEEKAFKSLAEAYTSKVFERFLIALTFANWVRPAHSKEERDIKVNFNRVLLTKKERLSDCFKKLQYGDNFVKHCIHPVGASVEPELPTVDDWRESFWHGCLEACEASDRNLLTTFYYKCKPYLKHAVIAGIGGAALAGSVAVGPAVVGGAVATGGKAILAAGGKWSLVGATIASGVAVAYEYIKGGANSKEGSNEGPNDKKKK